jgi:hypothetical protein
MRHDDFNIHRTIDFFFYSLSYMPPRKKKKVDNPPSASVALSAQNTELQQLLKQLITDAHDDTSFDEVSAYLKDTIAGGMSPHMNIPHDDTVLSLPLYLASINKLALLQFLLDDTAINFADCGVSANNMWVYLRPSMSDIPHVCAIMEHFGADLYAAGSVNMVLWIKQNLMLGQSLTDTLSDVPCPCPHLARAVVEVTPIHTQAVTIAAKQGFVDWIYREASRLEYVRPEGFSNWRSFYNHLRSEGVSESALVAVGTIVILTEEHDAEREPVVAQARAKAAAEAQVVPADPNVPMAPQAANAPPQPKAAVQAPAANPAPQPKAAKQAPAAANPAPQPKAAKQAPAANPAPQPKAARQAPAAKPVVNAIAKTCAKFEKLGDGLKSRNAEIITWVKGLSDANRKTLIAELCTDAYPATAHAVIRACINMADNLRHKYCEFVRVIVQSEIQIPIPTVAEVRRATH